jgi:hypothetical protein
MVLTKSYKEEGMKSIPAIFASICEYMPDSLLDAKISNKSTLLAIKLYLKLHGCEF